MSMPEEREQELLETLALNRVPGLGPRLQKTLRDHFDRPADVFKATDENLAVVPGIGQKIIQEIRSQNYEEAARREIQLCQDQQVNHLLLSDESYPARLKEIHDPPSVLYFQGELQPRDSLAIAIVGSRNCSHYGRRITQSLAYGLAQTGMTIVSGLARGIDRYAHEAAIEAKGRTIAILGNGLGQIYPPEHQELAQQVIANGALLTESPLDRKPSRGLFPQRNRLVSGMSLAVIIVEASKTSGSLHTARHAMEQGRDVFVVPGQVDSRESEGCLQLVRDGARMVRSVSDILEDLGPLPEPVNIGETDLDSNNRQPDREIRIPKELNLTEQQQRILSLLNSDPLPIDAVIDQATIEPSRVLSTLTILEMKISSLACRGTTWYAIIDDKEVTIYAQKISCDPISINACLDFPVRRMSFRTEGGFPQAESGCLPLRKAGRPNPQSRANG